MSDYPPPANPLIYWLNHATRGLPANIAQMARAELESHYLDAFDAHCREGLPAEQAAELALSELGSAAEVSDELRSAHLSRGHLIAAMLACTVYPLAIIAMSWTEAALGDYFALMIQDGVSLLVLSYVLITFVRLMGFDRARLARPAALIIAGIAINVFDRLIFYAVFRQLPLIGPDNAVYWNTASPLAVVMDWIFLGSEVLISLGVLWLCARLLRLPERLFGLQRVTAWVMLLTTPVGLAVVVALLLSNMFLAGLVSVLGYAVIVILLALLTLVFFRAAFRPTDVPLKTA